LFTVRFVRESRVSTVAEIEAAIERLPPDQVAVVAAWLNTLQARRATKMSVDAWLSRAVGGAKPGVTTKAVLKMTRGEE